MSENNIKKDDLDACLLKLTPSEKDAHQKFCSHSTWGVLHLWLEIADKISKQTCRRQDSSTESHACTYRDTEQLNESFSNISIADHEDPSNINNDDPSIVSNDDVSITSHNGQSTVTNVTSNTFGSSITST